ncbi:alginate O-acetyltransferase AlgX-related protein [Methylobacterium frigidaeris]|uniref:AlgX/AlgJ SGNH hydrolase-like domain-containing protein n=1 Tax=Methylobacterium frigidaeris TaxID=2038277 RepID=A0AA37HBD7_9HYPH|nr:hypothetical protein [Methylobacterium frigidaeris]PIK69764.1 hypothetical protein CS379_28165 [Methylobacterium frigidaeris]GJD62913.1 hypothetical protein MPEAHAMD_3073 [Methylobacterium frigidaeris]
MFHAGKDGWLFLTGGTNEVADQYRRIRPMDRVLRQWRRQILRRIRRCQGLGTRYLHLVVPEKLSIYEDRFDGLTLDPRHGPARRLGTLMRWSWPGRRAWIDLLGPMRARRDERDLHYRTDTHWNIHGCLLAYRLVCRACGATPRTDFLARPFQEFDAVLDIGNKLDAPPLETVRNYQLFRDAERVAGGRLIDAYAAAGRLGELHSGAHAVYRNRSADADPRTLVLFGDSCANFSPNGLTAMLAETFREVHFIWSSNLDWGYIERILPDIVLCEQVERFLPRVPEDDFDLAAAEAERLAALEVAA